MRMCAGVLWAVAAGMSWAGGAQAGDGIHADHKGRIRMLQAGGEFVPITTDVVVAAPKWRRQHRLGDARKVRREAKPGRLVFTGTIRLDGGGGIAFREELVEVDGAVRLTLRVEAERDVEVAGVHLFVYVPIRLFAGGRCEVIEPDPNAKLTATTMPATLPEDYHFLAATGKGVTMADAKGTSRLAVALDKPLPFIVQDARKWKGENYDVYFRLLAGKLAKGQSAEATVTLKLTVPADHRTVRLTLDAARKRARLWGFGGNFCYGVDSPVTRHNLAQIRMAYARVGVKLDHWESTNDNDSPDEINWAFFEAKDRPGTQLRADFLLARRLAELKVPYIASAWRVPEFCTARPGQGWRANKRKLPGDKWPEVLECIGSYLLYLKRAYHSEPEMFSFNESDIGVYVLMTPEEHRDWIKACGAYLARLGLKTKMLLGDATKKSNTAFVEPAAADPEAMKHVRAAAFHTWHQRPEHYKPWRDVARRLELPLLATEVGPDAGAWRDGSFNMLHYFAGEMRMYQEILLHAEAQALLEWEYTNDYRMVEVDKAGGVEKVRETPRFWMIRQFANLTPRPAVGLATTSDHDKVLLTAFAGAKAGDKRIVLHVANCGADRKATLTGLPAGVKRLAAVRTSWEGGHEKLPPLAAAGGRAELDLAAFSLLPLTGESR